MPRPEAAAAAGASNCYPPLSLTMLGAGRLKCLCDVSVRGTNPPAGQALTYLHGLPAIGPLDKRRQSQRFKAAVSF